MSVGRTGISMSRWRSRKVEHSPWSKCRNQLELVTFVSAIFLLLHSWHEWNYVLRRVPVGKVVVEFEFVKAVLSPQQKRPRPGAGVIGETTHGDAVPAGDDNSPQRPVSPPVVHPKEEKEHEQTGTGESLAGGKEHDQTPVVPKEQVPGGAKKEHQPARTSEGAGDGSGDSLSLQSQSAAGAEAVKSRQEEQVVHRGVSSPGWVPNVSSVNEQEHQFFRESAQNTPIPEEGDHAASTPSIPWEKNGEESATKGRGGAEMATRDSKGARCSGEWLNI